MKLVRIFLLLFLYFAVPVKTVRLSAQCTSVTIRSVSFDTLVNGSGNDNFSFISPQFQPSSGTLLSVVVKTNVSIGYAFQAENTSGSSRSINIGVGRYDYLSSTALNNSNFAASVQKSYGPYNLGPANAQSNSGSDYISNGPFSFLGNTIVINDSITTSTASFLGYGTVHFDYFPSTYSTIPQNLTYTFEAADTIHFSVTYYYCNATTLPNGIVDFSAEKQEDGSIKLSWTKENEENGTGYEIEESNDGKNFKDISFLSSTIEGGNASYHYSYLVSKEDKGEIYFRLKETDNNGTIYFSDIKMVDLGNGWGDDLLLFPNPAVDKLNLIFDSSNSANWQIDIFSANGALLQHKIFSANNSAIILPGKKFVPGVYFLRATNLTTQKTTSKSFIVQ